MVNDIWSCGISCLWNHNEMIKDTCILCRILVLIPEWDLKDLLRFCRLVDKFTHHHHHYHHHHHHLHPQFHHHPDWQGVSTNYDSDSLRGLIDAIIDVVESRTGQRPRFVDGLDSSITGTALKVLADHSRAAVSLIGDGLAPSANGRGYVLRRIIRRALRFASQLGIKGSDDVWLLNLNPIPISISISIPIPDEPIQILSCAILFLTSK